MDSKKIFNPTFVFVIAFITLMCATTASFLFAQGISAASTTPNVSQIASLPADFTGDPSVMMDGYRVSAIRYVAVVDGIEYETFCADPMLRGPENAAAVYEIAGEANSRLKNALKNGFPINSEWSSINLSNDDRMWWVYVTRVAVAMANNPTRNFTGDGTAIDQAKRLADGLVVADSNAYPPIAVNGVKDAKDTGREINVETARSNAFEIVHNRKTGLFYNPFRFEWALGTPAGAKLIVNGIAIATAPDNPDTVFKDNITSFHI